jgi:hypothetical protein
MSRIRIETRVARQFWKTIAYYYSGREILKISSITEFRENIGRFVLLKNPILVTRRGRLAGVFFPQPETSLPIELKRELLSVLSLEVARQIRGKALREEDILNDFRTWRANKRG